MQHAFFWNSDRRIRYFYAGNPRNETIVLLHGWSMDASAYKRLAKKLSEKYYVIVPDLPGFGGSQPKADPDMTYFADDLADLLQSVNQRQVTIVGHSLGGAVGIHLAQHHPHWIKHLILIDSTGIPTTHNLPVWGWLALKKAVRNLRYPIGSWQVLRAFGWNLVRHPKWLGGTFYHTTTCDLIDLYHENTKPPITVFWADKDDFYPSGDPFGSHYWADYQVIHGTHDWPITDPNLAFRKISEVLEISRPKSQVH